MGAGLGAYAEVAHRDQGEHDERDHAAERGDRREVEPDCEDHGDERGDQQPAR